MTLLFAGYDTSSITLAYAFFLMSKYPGIASRVRGEISSVVGKEGDLTYEDATSRLPFCTAVINEVMRLFPPVPLTTRHLEEDLELRVNEGTTTVLPAGTMVFLPIWWIHRSSLNFDRPEHFDPDRFFDETRAADIHRYAHIPFSGGARDCIGRRFAMMEVLTIFAHVMRRADFSCAADYELRPEVHGFLQKPPEGVVLTVRSLLQE
jgi:cytochrome P450